jgi:hypothetical protein
MMDNGCKTVDLTAMHQRVSTADWPLTGQARLSEGVKEASHCPLWGRQLARDRRSSLPQWDKICDFDSLILGPLSTGGKARWKFPKIWVLCTDKFSKISPNMFRLQQAFTQKVKICSDCASGLKKNPNLFRLANQTLKKPQNLFRLANQASKNTNFVQIGLILLRLIPNDRQTTNCK